MKQSFKKYGLIVCVLALSACDKTPGVYTSKGDPESLLDLSSETVTLGLGSKDALSRLADIVGEDKPTGAQLKCSLNSARCAQAKEIFERNSVPINLTSEKNNSVVLSYERLMVRDCNPHYIDNMRGSRSYNHPSFGCAVAGNMVQMVSDKHQFTNPELMELPDAEKAGQNYKNYLKPSEKRQTKAADWVSTTSGK